MTLGAVTVGAVTSFVKVSVVCVVLPAASAPVTVSVGEVEVPCDQENAFDTYGPPAGDETVDGVCDQPVLRPTRDAVAEEAGPDTPSETAFVSVTDPPPVT